MVGGKVRKYYSLTDEGQRALAEAKEKIRELVGEVLEGHGPSSLALPEEENEIDPEQDQEEGK